MVREGIILNLIKGKDVLDIGSVGQTDKYSLWNLYQPIQVNSLTGIDIPEAENEKVKTFGISPDDRDKHIVFGNMETYSFGRQFDVIIAGDVIEHVENQGLFLRNIHRHLRDNGTLVITTPNAQWLTVIGKPNPTHTLWHDRYTLERILNLSGLKIEDFRYYYGNKKHYNFVCKILTLRQSMLLICKKSKTGQ